MAWGLTLRSCTRLHQRVLHAVIDGDGQVGGHRPRRGRPHRQRRVGYTPLPQGIGHVGPCAQHCTHVKARPIAAELVCHGIPRATWACDSSALASAAYSSSHKRCRDTAAHTRMGPDSVKRPHRGTPWAAPRRRCARCDRPDTPAPAQVHPTHRWHGMYKPLVNIRASQYVASGFPWLRRSTACNRSCAARGLACSY